MLRSAQRVVRGQLTRSPTRDTAQNGAALQRCTAIGFVTAQVSASIRYQGTLLLVARSGADSSYAASRHEESLLYIREIGVRGVVSRHT